MRIPTLAVTLAAAAAVVALPTTATAAAPVAVNDTAQAAFETAEVINVLANALITRSVPSPLIV